MADNFTTLDASDASITGGADEIAGVKYPRVKLIHGVDGTNDGDVSTANGLPVQGTVTANLSATDNAVLDAAVADLDIIAGDTTAIQTAVELLDNAVDGNYLNANANIAGTDITGGAGAVAAGTPRVTLASDDPAVAKLGTIDTDTGSIATDASTIAGDTTSIDGKTPALGQALAAASVPVVMPAADISTLTPQTDALTDTELRAADVKVTLDSEKVAVSGIDAGTNLIGKVGIDQVTANANEVVVKSGSCTVDLGANNDVTVTNATAANCKVEATIAAAQTIAVTNAGTFAVQAAPTVPAGATAGQGKLDHADVTTAQAITTAVADKYFYITSLTISSSVAGNFWVEDDDATQITCKFYFAPNGGSTQTFTPQTPWKSTTVNKGLKIKGSVAGSIGAMITYYTAT